MAHVKKIPFVPVSVKILEAAARSDFSRGEFQIVLLVWRLTYGWGQKWSEISYNTLARGTKISRRNTIKIVQGLVNRKVLKRKQSFKGKMPIYTYKFQKDFDRWKPRQSGDPTHTSLIPKVVIQDTPEVVIQDTPEVVIPRTPAERPTPYIVTEKKDSIIDNSLVDANASTPKKPTKKPPEPYDQNTPEYKLAELLWQLIKERNNGHKEPKLDKWAKDMELMLRIDKRSPQQAAEVICWAQADADFWQAVILSPKNLRKHFDRLTAKMKLKPHPRQRGGIEFLQQLKEGGQSWVEKRSRERETSGL